MIKKITKILVVALLAVGIFVPTVSAHQSPQGCFTNTESVGLAIFRDAGATDPILGGETVQSGEEIFYRATLSATGGDNCDYSEGTLEITTPDGTANVTPIGGIPLVEAGNSFVSELVPYVVSESDVVGGNIEASTDYSDGLSHTGDGHDTASGHVDRNVPYQDVELIVEKDAFPAFDRRCTWNIDKSVDEDVHQLANGESGTSNYDVTVDADCTDEDYTVAGSIHITNPAEFADAIITDVTDVVGAINADVICPEVFPFALGAGETLHCSYTADLLGDSFLVNTATALTSGDVDGGEGTANVDFEGVVPFLIGFDLVNIDDSVEGDLGSCAEGDAPCVFEYSREFFCNEDAGQHDNTATIVETEQFDEQSVNVYCALGVEKTASTSYNREWDWTIDKSADQTSFDLENGGLQTVNYEVTVTPESTDVDHEVTGQITISNPVGNATATITSIDDVLDVAGVAAVDCGGNIFPYDLVGGGELVCSYSASSDGTDSLNTATVNTSGLVLGGSDDADVIWGDPDNEIDECVIVDDNNANFPGQTEICADYENKTIEYSVDFGFNNPDADINYEVCGLQEYINTADFVTNDTQSVGDDSATVTPNPLCDFGCSLTQGYWKTHSEQGPAPYDDTWALLPLGADEPFFLSGKTWLEVFNTPVKGNVYFSLAHQYMAAHLNMLSGADTSSISDALADAETLLGLWTPAEIAELKGNDPLRQQFVDLAGALASYNEGEIGPGHCSE